MAPDEKRSLDAALRAALRPEAGHLPGCDAELAVAYLERRLGREERQRFETHMAACAGCRAFTAALVAESLPDTTDSVPARRPWGWIWAVPAMAGLAIVGSVVYYQRTTPVISVNKPPVPVNTSNVYAEQPAAVDQLTTPPPQQPRDARKRSRAASPTVSAAKVESPAPPPARAPVPAVAAESQLRDAGQAAQQVAPQKEQAAERREAVRLLATSSETPGTPIGGVAGFRISSQLSPLPEGAPLRGTTQHNGVLWAVSDGGRIFRSGDLGRTWTKIESPTTADLAGVKWDAQKNLLVVEDKQGKRYEIRP